MEELRRARSWRTLSFGRDLIVKSEFTVKEKHHYGTTGVPWPKYCKGLTTRWRLTRYESYDIPVQLQLRFEDVRMPPV